MSVGDNIKRRRCELKMTQQELAAAMGYKTRSTITKIESGENDVSQKKLQKFAAILDTSVEALIIDRDTSPETPTPLYNRKNRNVVIVLAGGTSSKNHQNVPSQFVSVHGKPILIHCMDVYQKHPSIDDIYVVCLSGWENIVIAYAEQHGISKLRGIFPEGDSAVISMKGCYDRIKHQYGEDDCIIIQESTKPLLNGETISNLLRACEEMGSATICHPMNDYVQFSTAGGYAEYIDRETTVALQSPEAHTFSLLNTVFADAEKNGCDLMESTFTMLLYDLGYDINFVNSPINNIKVAKEEDIMTYAALLKA